MTELRRVDRLRLLDIGRLIATTRFATFTIARAISTRAGIAPRAVATGAGFRLAVAAGTACIRATAFGAATFRTTHLRLAILRPATLRATGVWTTMFGAASFRTARFRLAILRTTGIRSATFRAATFRTALSHHTTFEIHRTAWSTLCARSDASAEHLASPIHMRAGTFAAAMLGVRAVVRAFMATVLFETAAAEVAIEIARIETAVRVEIVTSMMFAAVHFMTSIVAVATMVLMVARRVLPLEITAVRTASVVLTAS